MEVVGENGEAVPARVSIWTRDPNEALEFTAKAGEQALLEPLLPGTAKVFIMCDGYVTRVIDLTIPRHGADLGKIEVSRGGSVMTGTVAADLKVRPTEAYFRFAGAGIATRVQANGRFAFRGLPETQGAVVFRHEGRELFSRDVRVNRARVDLGLVRPRS
jgi:hypothetical protein